MYTGMQSLTGLPRSTLNLRGDHHCLSEIKRMDSHGSHAGLSIGAFPGGYQSTEHNAGGMCPAQMGPKIP